MSLRSRAGALIHDWPRFLARPWVLMRNRNESVATDGRGVRCDWEFTSELHLANVFPSAGARLMRRAFEDWPVEMRDAPRRTDDPLVTFIIGHRGQARLPHLLTALRSIAGQQDVPIECIVVEQAERREIESALPAWVRYVHTPLPAPGYEYNRAWTLNVGARLARGELLVLHDNDMLCPARYAAEAIARSGEGWQFLDLKRFTFYLADEATKEVFEGRLKTNVVSTVVQNLRGASIVASRDAYTAIGGFDESFVGWGGEDVEFWERAESLGRVYAFGYLPFMHLWHAPQKAKLIGAEAPAIRRYYELAEIAPGERIRRLNERSWGAIDAPAGE